MRKVQSQSTSNPCTVSQWAAVEALNGTQDYIAENNKMFTRRRNLVVDMLNEIDGVICPKTRGRVLCLSVHRRADRQDHQIWRHHHR